MGFFEYIRHLRPEETRKFTSSPGFHRLHDTIHRSTWVDVFDCWRLVAKSLGHDSLDKFATTKPLWASILEMLEEIVKKYIPGSDFRDICESDTADCNMCFENNVIQKQHGLLYPELCDSMNCGDVGQILHLFPTGSHSSNLQEKVSIWHT
jgi:hypothetical protein